MRNAKNSPASRHEPDYEHLLYECQREKMVLQRRVAELEAQVKELREQMARLKQLVANKHSTTERQNEAGSKRIVAVGTPIAW